MRLMSTDVEALLPKFQMLKDFGYHDINYDALWKWASILTLFDVSKVFNNPPNPKEIVIEAGGGWSPVGHFIGSVTDYYNVDINFGDRWFPPSIGLKDPHKYQTKIEQGFLDYIKTLEDNSVDYVIDGCSIIHFDISPENINNGLYQSCLEIKRVLRPGGIFIFTSDCLYPTKDNKNTRGEIIHPRMLLECIESAGLNRVSTMNLRSKKNLVIATEKPGPQHTKLVCDKPIDAWHQKGKLMSICSGMFRG